MDNAQAVEALAGIGGLIWLFLVLGIWSMIWKGIALWKAARNGHKAWFIVMFILNVFGILEIIYIFGFSKKKEEPIVPQA